MTTQTRIEELKKGCGIGINPKYEKGKLVNYDIGCGDSYGDEDEFTALCPECQAKLQTTEQTLKEVGDVLDDVGLELLFTDIKDKSGNKVELSDEFIEIIRIWWKDKSEELKSKLNLNKIEGELR